ncbi:MAG: hypothetical protein ACKVJU_11990 [Verrucomicrobiales bacterium]
MSEHPADSSENRLRATVAGALTFVSFGLLAGLVLWIADFKTGAEATESGQFTPAQIEKRDGNLKEVVSAQDSFFNQKKVEASMASFSASSAKASLMIVPGSETDLKNIAANAAKAAAAKDSEDPLVSAQTAPAPESKSKKSNEGKAKGAKAAGAPQSK